MININEAIKAVIKSQSEILFTLNLSGKKAVIDSLVGALMINLKLNQSQFRDVQQFAKYNYSTLIKAVKKN